MSVGIKAKEDEIKEILTPMGFYLINFYSKNWKTRVVISDIYGYKYDVVLRNLITTKGKINFVDKSNPFSIENISLWLYKNNPEIEIDENNIYVGTDDKLKFYHRTCNEFFYMGWHSIYSGHGCSVCRGMQIGEKTSLSYLRPDIAIQMSPENKFSGYELTLSSNKDILWICQNCGYNWIASVCERTRGQNCPACSNPPKVLTDRTRLSILFPDLCNEWDFELNNGLLPENMFSGSNKKVWWLCKNKHSYFTSIKSRTTENSGCPKCNESKGEKRIEKFLTKNNINFISQFKFKNCKSKRELPFDFYLNDYNIAIEYDGIFHYEDIFYNDTKLIDVQHRDSIKTQYCQNNNIPLLRIPYWEFNNIEEIIIKFLQNF